MRTTLCLLALISATLVAASTAASGADITLAAAAKVVNITVWSIDQPGPTPWGGQDDAYSVTIRNPSSKSSPLHEVSFTLFARNHGQPDPEAVLYGSSGYFLSAKPPTWVVHLLPGRTTTVFFLTRSAGDDQYCAGGTITKPQKCSRGG